MRLLLAIFCSLLLIACDSIPEEGTIVYDVDFPRADEVDSGGSGSGGSTSGSGSGTGSGGGSGTGTTGSGSGSGGYDPDNSSIGYTITESGGSTDIIEGATDTFDIVLNSAPTDNITITVTTPNTGDILISNAGGSLSADNTTLTLTFTPLNWNTPQSVTVTGVEDATDEGGGTTAVNLTVSLTQSLDTDWVPADIPDSTITANLTDSQATGPPSAPTGLTATSTEGGVDLSWTEPSGASSYTIYWTTNTGTPIDPSNPATYTGSLTITAPDSSESITGLDPSQDYDFTIIATNGVGDSSPTAEINAQPIPATPTGLTATDSEGGGLNVSWNSSIGRDNYTVYWTSNPAVPIDPSNPSTYDGSTTVTGTSTSITGLSVGTPYDVTVVATNAGGTSSPAAEVNATPTLVMPAAMDNVTAYYGFYGKVDPCGTSCTRKRNFHPAYAWSWNPHPDFDGNGYYTGDKYIVYVSDNLSQPIDPDDSSTWTTRTTVYDREYALIETWPIFTHDNAPYGPDNKTYNDDFLTNTPIKYAVVFSDASKGDLLSPAVEGTPTMASEAYREWGDLRIHGGFFESGGDNNTLYGFGVYNSSIPIRIEHKDMVNVGERLIFDGSWLRSEVFPQSGGQIGYDYMYLNWHNPNILNNFTIDGTLFKRSSGSGWRLEGNSATPNGRCGTGNAEDCDWAMEISSEDTVGLIIQNETGLVYQGYPYSTLTYNGTGTLDGPTDYASESIAAQTYTSNQDATAWYVDNASYAGLFIASTKDRYQINLANADAAIRKVGIAVRPPTNLAGTTPASTQQVNLTWNKSTDSLRDSHVIYWKKYGCGFSCVTIDPNDNSTYDGRIVTGRNTESYVHSGLDGGSYYHYVIRAETNVGGVSTIDPVPPTAAFSAQTKSFPGGGPINPDADPDLVVYYDFNDSGGGNFLENKAPNTLGSYNLTAAGSEIIPAGSRFTGNTAAYFDASEGYAYANDVNQTNISELGNTGNFTISVWIYPDQDMTNFSSVMSTADGTNKGTGGFQISQTSSNPDPNKIGMYAQNVDLKLEGPAILDNTWYHVVFTKEQNGLDDGTGTFYVDGVQEDQLTDFKTGWVKLKIGINRVTQNNWKGYIDEFKIYKRALTGAEVTNLYNNGTP